MANRYWVGGSGTWSDTDTTHWATTSGGTAGASAPGNSDNIIFDANSFSGSCTVVAGGSFATCSGFDSTAVTGLLTINKGTASTIQCRGNCALKTTQMNFELTFLTTTTSTYTLTMDVTDATIDYKSAPSYINSIGISGSVTLNLGSKVATTPDVFSGIFNTQNFDMTGNSFTVGSGSTANLGSSNIRMRSVSCPNAGTLNAGTSIINVIPFSGTSCTFTGASYTWNTVNMFIGGQTSVFQVVISGANTFANLTIQPGFSSLKLPSATTNTVTGALTINSTSANPLSIISDTSGSAATISKTSGAVAVSYVSIKDSTVTGGATFNATNSTNVSNNTGWSFVGFQPQGAAMPFL